MKATQYKYLIMVVGGETHYVARHESDGATCYSALKGDSFIMVYPNVEALLALSPHRHENAGENFKSLGQFVDAMEDELDMAFHAGK